MTIGGWISFIVLALTLLVLGGCVAFVMYDGSGGMFGFMLSIVITLVLMSAMYSGFKWYYSSTASGQRALIDQQSDLSGGINRTVTVYTANGDVIAEYKGRIDIETNDGGYVKFDFDGKRYIYYNCFVETIADIN